VVTKEPSQRPGEDDLVGVALEVTQDRRAEDCGHDNAAEEGEDEVDEAGGERTVEQDFVIAGVDEVVDGNRHEAEREEEQEVNVGRYALRAKFELECKEFPKLCHVDPSVSVSLTLW